MGPRQAEVIPVDAYSSYIKKLSDARTAELRREAADFRLSTTARLERRARWVAAVRRLLKRRQPAPASGVGQQLEPLLAVGPGRRQPAVRVPSGQLHEAGDGVLGEGLLEADVTELQLG
jgi:hypothetical protein